MRRVLSTFGICVAVALAVYVQPVWGVLNNGFETDYVYVTRTMGDPNTLQIRRHRESDGTEVDRLLPAGNWASLTFAGTGTNDARLFSIGRSGTNDIEVAELSATGPNAVKTINLSTLAGSLGTLPSEFVTTQRKVAPLSARVVAGVV